MIEALEINADGYATSFVPQVYDRATKIPSVRSGKVMRSSYSTSWERKMKDKAERQQFLGMKKEALAEAKDKRKVRVERGGGERGGQTGGRVTGAARSLSLHALPPHPPRCPLQFTRGSPSAVQAVAEKHRILPAARNTSSLLCRLLLSNDGSLRKRRRPTRRRAWWCRRWVCLWPGKGVQGGQKEGQQFAVTCLEQ